MSSALGGLSAAKRRRGTTQPTSAPVGGRQPTFINQQNEVVSNLKQVTPIEMLKIHEARLRRIESMSIIESGGEVAAETQPIMFDSRVGELIADHEKTKKSVSEVDISIRELRASILTLQALVISSSQTIEKLKSDIDDIKTEMATKELARVTIGEEKLQPVVEGEVEGEVGEGE